MGAGSRFRELQQDALRGVRWLAAEVHQQVPASRLVVHEFFEVAAAILGEPGVHSGDVGDYLVPQRLGRTIRGARVSDPRLVDPCEASAATNSAVGPKFGRPRSEAAR